MIIVMDWRNLQQRMQQAEPDNAAPAGRKQVSRVQQLAIALGMVVVLAVGAGAWFFAGSDGGPRRVGSSQDTLASTALTTVRDVGAFLRENVTRDLSHIASLLRTSGEESTEDAAEDEGADAELAAALDEAVSRAPRRRRREPTAPPDLQAGIGPMPWAELPREAPLFMVFDSSHPDVEPPGAGDIRLRSEFLPASLLQSIADQELESEGETESGFEQVGLVEVIVSEMGEVERARLISLPQNVHESMLLSAIKAWHFTPAVKDGMAVRYRQVMPIIVAR